MTGPRPRTVEYLRFLAWTVGLAALLALLGYLPTKRWGGESAVHAMLAGCGVSVLASALGGVPVMLFAGAGGTTGALAGMALRFGAILVLTLAAALSGLFERGPLLVWVGLSYIVLLVVDTRFALGSLSKVKQEK